MDIPPAVVYGLVKKPQLIRLDKNLREVTVGFKPYYFQLFVGEAMDRLSGGRLIDLLDVCDEDNVQILLEQMNLATNDTQLLLAINHFDSGLTALNRVSL